MEQFEDIDDFMNYKLTSQVESYYPVQQDNAIEEEKQEIQQPTSFLDQIKNIEQLDIGSDSVMDYNYKVFQTLFGKLPKNIIRIFGTADIKQRTPQWYQLRKITASKIKDCIDPKEAAGFVLDQSGEKTFVNNIYVHTGKNLEYLSQYFYSQFFQAKVLEMSIVPHEKHDFVGATPDGFSIRQDNEQLVQRLLEIKCPSKRKINTNGNSIFQVVPYDYLLQCFMQMECCQIDETDFWQSRIMVFDTEEQVRHGFAKSQVQITKSDSEDYKNYQTVDCTSYQGEFMGCCLKLYQEKSDDELDTVYLYPNKINYTMDQFKQWVEEQKIRRLTEPFIENGITYQVRLDKGYYKFWRLENAHLCVIHKNPGWFVNNIKKMKQSWFYIQFLRKHKDVWQTLNANRKNYVSGFMEKNKQLVSQRFGQFVQDIEKFIEQKK